MKESEVSQVSGEDDLFVIVALFPASSPTEPRIRSSIVADPIHTLRQWRAKYGPHIPVVIHRAGELEDGFVDQMRNVFRNPEAMTIAGAAKLFYRLRLDRPHQLYMTSSIRKTGELGVSLLREWMKAVLDYDRESGPLRRLGPAIVWD